MRTEKPCLLYTSGARDGEGLDALTDDGGSLRGGLGALLDGQRAAQGVSPVSYTHLQKYPLQCF